LKTWISILALLITFVSLAEEVTPNKPISCDSIGECKTVIIDRGLAREAEKYGMKIADTLLAKHVKLMGDIATPMLMELIQHQSYSVRRLAGFTLMKFEDIDEKYLPIIIKALDNDTPWLVNVLGNINSPAAAEEAVKRYLFSNSAPHNQEFNALKNSGNLAVPYIIEALKCEVACPNDYIYNFGRVVVEIKADRSYLLSSFEKLISDKELTDEIIAGAIGVIAFLEEDALAIEPKLTKLLKERPSLENTINNAFIAMGTSRGIELLIGSIQGNPAPYNIIEIAKKGTKAHAAAPVLLTVIEKGHTEERMIATRALGFIGNTNAVPALIELLTERFDVELNITATQSLAMLGEETALIPLEEIKNSHWYPPVRKAAEEAILVIEGTKQLDKSDDVLRAQSAFMRNRFMTEKMCESITLDRKEVSPSSKLYKETNPDELKQLSYDTHVLSYGARDRADQELDGKEIIEVNSSNMMEIRTPVKQVPELALKVENGWLTGSDRGEWGGELVFIDEKGNSSILLNTNIEDIYRLGELTIATTGLAHMGMNNGAVYKLELNKAGGWEASHWIKLPGVPRSSWFVETSELLINTLRGGSILLSENGSMRMAECK
jgi:HEAT repeat protein